MFAVSMKIRTGHVLRHPGIGGFRGRAKGLCSPELGPNKFQGRPSGAFRMQENLLAASVPPWTPLGGAYSTHPDGGKGAEEGWLPPVQGSHPRSLASAPK